MPVPTRFASMPVIRFSWNPQLIEVRREACPRARWDKTARAWTMTTVEAEAFLAASHKRLEFGRSNSQIAIDDEQWLIGFVQGAPMKLAKSGRPG
jgi:hypothetical protein